MRRRKRDRTLSNASALSTDESSSVSIEEEEEHQHQHKHSSSRGRRSRLLSAPTAPSAATKRPGMAVRGPDAVVFMPPPTPTASRSTRPHESKKSTTDSLSDSTRSHDISLELSPPASPDTLSASHPGTEQTAASLLNLDESVDELKIGQQDDNAQPMSTSTTATTIEPIKESDLSTKEAVKEEEEDDDDVPAISVTATMTPEPEQVIKDTAKLEKAQPKPQQQQQQQDLQLAEPVVSDVESNDPKTTTIVKSTTTTTNTATATNSFSPLSPENTITTNFSSSSSSDLTVRVEYFDRKRQGKITMLDTFACTSQKKETMWIMMKGV